MDDPYDFSNTIEMTLPFQKSTCSGQCVELCKIRLYEKQPLEDLKILECGSELKKNEKKKNRIRNQVNYSTILGQSQN